MTNGHRNQGPGIRGQESANTTVLALKYGSARHARLALVSEDALPYLLRGSPMSSHAPTLVLRVDQTCPVAVSATRTEPAPAPLTR